MAKRESNILKCVAIMLMLAHHLFMWADQPNFPALIYGPLLTDGYKLSLFGRLGKVCVSIFVLITAYGTTMSYRGDSMNDGGILMSRSLHRLVKLLISFQFVYLLAAVLNGLLGKGLWLNIYGGSNRLEAIVFALIEFMGVQHLFYTPRFNSAWWYMSFAISLVLLLPYVIKLCRRMGAYILFPAILVELWLGMGAYMSRYFMPMLVGVILAENDTVEAVKTAYGKLGCGGKSLSLAALAALISAEIFIWLRSGNNWLYVIDLLLCLSLSLFTLLSLARIPGLSSAAEFVGKHSMNMFFFHAFIYQNWFYDFTYSLRYPILIFVFLFASSLAASVVIEWLKKLCRLDRLVQIISRKLTALFLRKAEHAAA